MRSIILFMGFVAMALALFAHAGVDPLHLAGFLDPGTLLFAPAAVTLTAEQRDATIAKFNAFLDERASQNTLRERNREKLKKHTLNNVEMKQLRERMKARIGWDPITETEKFPAMKESFSWKKFNHQLESQLKEADSGTMFPLFLVAGVLQNVIGMYQTAKVSYQDWVTVTPTNLVDTPVAPLHGLTFPREVGEQLPYPVARTAGLSMKLHARKYGDMYECTRELLEDDQTGQFKYQTGQLGEYLQLLTEVLCYGRLASVDNMSYAGFTPGKSETKPASETNYPWTKSTAPFVGGGFNQATAGVLNVANIEAGMIALRQQMNLLGIVLPINPNRILVSPKYMFDVAVILNSAYFPAVGGNAGTTGTSFAINPLKGIADATVTPFMFDQTGACAQTSKAWYLVDDSKPWFQLLVKEPVSVEQENPQAGQSFERDILRFKARTRIIADHIDPRFAWQGSDGST